VTSQLIRQKTRDDCLVAAATLLACWVIHSTCGSRPINFIYTVDVKNTRNQSSCCRPDDRRSLKPANTACRYGGRCHVHCCATVLLSLRRVGDVAGAPTSWGTGHVPPTFTNGCTRGASWVGEQHTRNWPNCILTTMKALTKTTNCVFRAKKWRGTTKNFSGAWRRIGAPTLALDRCPSPTFKFVPAPLWRCRVWSGRGRNDGQLRDVRHVRYCRPVTLPKLYETVRKFSLPRNEERRRRVLPAACRHAIRHAVSRSKHDSQNVRTWHPTAPFPTSRREPHRCHARCRLLPLLLRCWYFVLNAELKYLIIPGLHKLKLSVFALFKLCLPPRGTLYIVTPRRTITHFIISNFLCVVITRCVTIWYFRPLGPYWFSRVLFCICNVFVVRLPWINVVFCFVLSLLC